ncbi:hypothetical protein GL279_18940 [Paracoccus limosus]|uniref:Uncharacterized protein n=1 Tax=Paracoccus limosus TaxID=913252 RepID=A0A844HA74_9RHOB|nr:hypothetical protein [Paracoccus limosus]MTH36650.1 hypothetical protein [Paracoccus limosus]
MIAMPAVMVALPGAALGALAPTPVQRLFHRWEAAKRAENAVYASSDDDARHPTAWQARWAVEERLMQVPSVTPHDVLRKAAAWANYGQGDLEGADNPHLTLFWTELSQTIGCRCADAPALGAAADPGLELLALWHQAHALIDALNAVERADDPAAWDARAGRLTTLQDQIAAAPAATPLAWAVKILNANDGDIIENTCTLGAALVAQARTFLERYA